MPDMFFRRAWCVLVRYWSGHRIYRMRRPDLDNLPELIVPSGYELRTYHPDDAEAWVKIVNGSINHIWSTRRFRKEIVAASHFEPENLFFATFEQQPVGTAYASRNEALSDVGLLHEIAVSPQHRRHSLGKCLSLAALHRLRELGYKSVTLVTDTSSEAAITMYRNLGFHEDSMHERSV